MTRIITAIASAALIAACGQQDGGEASSAIGESRPGTAATPAEVEPDVIYVPTPNPVVHEMLRLAEVGPADVVYDLGCGDGRIAIAAVRDFGARKAVCVDIDPRRVSQARANVRFADVADRVEVRQGDLFETDVSEATVVTLYLLDSLNEKLRPRLLEQLRPGARVVSQTFDMGDWQPEVATEVDGKDVYLWTIPADRTALRFPR